MFVGVDFPSFFDGDNFTGHNMHDPESFITGKELEAGYTYENSRRDWRDYKHYVSAVIGDLTPEQIAEQAPRRFNPAAAKELGPLGCFDYAVAVEDADAE